MQDPVCGMDVQKKGAQHIVHRKDKTVYFCSSQCKDAFINSKGGKTARKKKGVLARFLDKLAQENQDTFGGTPPSCH